MIPCSARHASPRFLQRTAVDIAAFFAIPSRTNSHRTPPEVAPTQFQPPSHPPAVEALSRSPYSVRAPLFEGDSGIDRRESVRCLQREARFLARRTRTRSVEVDGERDARSYRNRPCAAGRSDDSNAVASWRTRHVCDHAKRSYSSSDVANGIRGGEAAAVVKDFPEQCKREMAGTQASPEPEASLAANGHAGGNTSLSGNPATQSLCDVPVVRRASSYGRVDDALLRRLQSIVGDSNVTTNRTVLEQHGRDESYHEPMPPDAVVFPQSTHHVQQLVAACAARRVPIIPYGAGTSLEGHVAALCGGVSIDLSQLSQVLEVHAEDMDCRVQAGVTRQQLNHHLHDSGFLSRRPGLRVHHRGHGSNKSIRHQCCSLCTMRDAVLGVTAVLPTGRS
ncbi:hypothetical protein CLOM_g432 [Closterium sp. NIES-68]|nr:hypothetical protein CLOM_g432 [Closterium sp. NIES-68]